MANLPYAMLRFKLHQLFVFIYKSITRFTVRKTLKRAILL